MTSRLRKKKEARIEKKHNLLLLKYREKEIK